MARRKPQAVPAVPAGDVDAPPTPELLRFRPSQPAPIGQHGRPEPWAVKWQPREFEEWLRARQRWRETHSGKLPSLPARERLAMRNTAGQLDRDVVQAEQTAPRAEPDWLAQSRDRRPIP